MIPTINILTQREEDILDKLGRVGVEGLTKEEYDALGTLGDELTEREEEEDLTEQTDQWERNARSVGQTIGVTLSDKEEEIWQQQLDKKAKKERRSIRATGRLHDMNPNEKYILLEHPWYQRLYEQFLELLYQLKKYYNKMSLQEKS
jgi:hypothetical protein